MIANPGFRAVCAREVLKDLSESAKLLIEDKIQKMGVGHLFNVQRDRIIGPKNGLIIFRSLQDYNAESVKSIESFNRCWIEEAQTVTERSLSVLRPSFFRVDDSQIWFSWNPRRAKDAVDDFLRANSETSKESKRQPPTDAIVVRANWRDNPWFPDGLKKERAYDLQNYPERCDNIWEGGYAKAFEGAYFAQGLAAARTEGRITKVSADPMLPLRAFWDIGGSGAFADANAVWIVQFIGQEIRVLDYLETVGQVLAYHVAELRKRGYERAICHLPHDGIKENDVTGKRYAEHLGDAGFDVPMPTPNQGKGATQLRIEAVRRLFPKIWFNEATTEAGRDALGYYHERKDENRDVGLGPEHDWSSHAADAFGLMAVNYEEPSRKRAFNRILEYPRLGLA